MLLFIGCPRSSWTQRIKGTIRISGNRTNVQPLAVVNIIITSDRETKDRLDHLDQLGPREGRDHKGQEERTETQDLKDIP